MSVIKKEKSNQISGEKFIISPWAAVHWINGNITISPGTSSKFVMSFETDDFSVVRLLNEFSTPTTIAEVTAKFPEQNPEDVIGVIEHLQKESVLITEKSIDIEIGELTETEVYSTQPLLPYDTIAYTFSHQCNASCRHCLYPAALRKKDDFEPSVAKKIFSDIPKGIRSVALTGGEPFLRIDRLLALIKNAKKQSLSVSVISNGLWANKSTRAKKILKACRQAGLQLLAVSIDKYRKPALPVEKTKALFDLAHELGLMIQISSVGSSSIDDVLSLRSHADNRGYHIDLQLIDLSIHPHHKSNSFDLAFDAEKNQPCDGVLKGPSVTPDGTILVCCGLVNEPASFFVQGNIKKQSLSKIVEKCSRNVLLAAVASLGPLGLYELVGTKNDQVAQKGMCMACNEFFGNKHLRQELVKQIADSQELRRKIFTGLEALKMGL